VQAVPARFHIILSLNGTKFHDLLFLVGVKAQSLDVQPETGDKQCIYLSKRQGRRVNNNLEVEVPRYAI